MKKILCMVIGRWAMSCMALSPKGPDVAITDELQHAIDSVSQLQGGGTVALSPGVYCVGSLRLKSNVNLHLDENSVLLGSVNPYDYFGYGNGEAVNGETNHFALIMAAEANDVSITGKGTIDGRGLDLALAIDILHHIGERIDPNYNVRRMQALQHKCVISGAWHQGNGIHRQLPLQGYPGGNRLISGVSYVWGASGLGAVCAPCRRHNTRQCNHDRTRA